MISFLFDDVLKNCYILCDLVFIYMYMSFDFRLPVTVWLQCISIHHKIKIKSLLFYKKKNKQITN